MRHSLEVPEQGILVAGASGHVCNHDGACDRGLRSLHVRVEVGRLQKQKSRVVAREGDPQGQEQEG